MTEPPAAPAAAGQAAAEPVLAATPRPGDTEDDWAAERDGQGGPPSARRADAAPVLDVEGFEGPLDLLLEVARRQRLDLGRLSILDLTDQLVAALGAGEGRVPLERRGDWLVMAATLVLLKARLLAPPADPEAAARAGAEVVQRLARLGELARMRAAAAWLAARPQLGREVLGRGGGLRDRPAPPRAELVVAFLEATLAMLEGPDGQGRGEAAPAAWRPTPPELWRLGDALARVRRLLGEDAAGGPLERFLPEIASDGPVAGLQRRAALASTLAAGLELARDGLVLAEQDAPFGPVRLRARPPPQADATLSIERGAA